MGANRRLALLLMAMLSLAACAQTVGTGKTVRRHKAAEESATAALVREAEAAIDKKDFATAEPKLEKATAADPKDYRAWFDLGFVYSSTGRKPQAIEAYRKAVALKPDAFEPNVNLGVLLASASDPEAEKYLRAATRLKPVMSKPEEGQARAWAALGMFLEDRQPAEAIRAYQAASLLTPSDPEPHLATATLAEKAGDFPTALKEFQKAALLDPKSAEAIAGLANVYMRTRRYPEAEAALRKYIAVEPGKVDAHLQLGRVLRELDRPEDANAEFEAAAKLAPTDVAVLRELADTEASAKRYPEAEARYLQLLRLSPNDPGLHSSLGSVLLRQKKFPQAEQEFLSALKLRPDLVDAYGDLAVAAAENKHYELAIKALDVRARLKQPETPATYFLRATSYDNLHAYPEAVDYYHKFLEAAAGKYPDQEWQARHRLIAIEPMGKRKKN